LTIVDLLYPRLRGGDRAVGVVGHRGARATHPENTLDAFRHAILCGADAVELDIVVTLDWQLAVTHDPVDAVFADLPPSVPKLEDVLALAPGNNIVFDIEMKECGVDYADMLLARLEGPELRDRIMVRSFRHAFLRAIHKSKPNLPTVALVEQSGCDWIEICAAAGAACISPRFENANPSAIAQAHAAGIAVMPWTVNDPRDWARLIAMGVDAIVTDDPAALVRFLK
jgi:glycerophosphoryl diester phosphodiesterase